MYIKFFKSDGKNLSYIDFGGTGDVVITLHGHFGCASMFSDLASRLKHRYRVISLDQQGHGFSDWGVEYTRNEYIRDIERLYEVLGIDQAILIGHSLGGVNAYQFEARYPQRVKAMVIEDIGIHINDDLNFILQWPRYFNTAKQCYHFLDKEGINNHFYFLESLRQDESGWFFRFDINGLVKSQINLNGYWRSDWEKGQCPCLLMRGENSNVLSHQQAEELCYIRDDVTYKEFSNCGHTIRDGNFKEYSHEIIKFLDRISR